MMQAETFVVCEDELLQFNCELGGCVTFNLENGPESDFLHLCVMRCHFVEMLCETRGRTPSGIPSESRINLNDTWHSRPRSCPRAAGKEPNHNLEL